MQLLISYVKFFLHKHYNILDTYGNGFYIRVLEWILVIGKENGNGENRIKECM